MRSNQSTVIRLCVVALVLLTSALLGTKCSLGLNAQARQELADAGVNKYLGEFVPVASEDVGDGWTKHTFDPEGGAGPICIAGTPYSVFTRAGNPHKLLIFEQGGGACWQNFYFCNVLAEAQAPPEPNPEGIWDFANPDNPFADYSIVYMPYCDGSVFSGDNQVVDPSFPFGAVRFHRGLRNQSAGMDVAKDTFPNAASITLAGSSAGGVGVAGFAPFLVRFLYGNLVNLSVFNDAGPVAVNLNEVAGITARANDWQFGQFYPASCTECSDTGQATEIIKWRLDNDSTIREALYETDADATNRFFLQPPFGMSQADFRALIVTEHGILNAAHPLRYKRFIVTADTTHTALQTPLFYTQDANGFPLKHWTRFFVNVPLLWPDIVEDFVPLP
jgi:hypothetical protein